LEYQVWGLSEEVCIVMLVDNYANSLEAITLILINVFDFKIVPNTEEQIMEAMLKVVK